MVLQENYSSGSSIPPEVWDHPWTCCVSWGWDAPLPSNSSGTPASRNNKFEHCRTFGLPETPVIGYIIIVACSHQGNTEACLFLSFSNVCFWFLFRNGGARCHQCRYCHRLFEIWKWRQTILLPAIGFSGFPVLQFCGIPWHTMTYPCNTI